MPHPPHCLLHTHTHINTHAYTCTCTHTYIGIYTCIYTHMHAYFCLLILLLFYLILPQIYTEGNEAKQKHECPLGVRGRTSQVDSGLLAGALELPGQSGVIGEAHLFPSGVTWGPGAWHQSIHRAGHLEPGRDICL